MRFSNFLQKTLDSFWQIAQVTELRTGNNLQKRKVFQDSLHAMHKTSKKQKSEKIHADFSGTSREIVCMENSFHKNFQKEQPLRPAFFEKESEEDALPEKKSTRKRTFSKRRFHSSV